MRRELALWLALWVPTLLATIGTCIAWRELHRLRLAVVVALLTPFRLCLPPGCCFGRVLVAPSRLERVASR